MTRTQSRCIRSTMQGLLRHSLYEALDWGGKTFYLEFGVHTFSVSRDRQHQQSVTIEPAEKHTDRAGEMRKTQECTGEPNIQ